MWRTPGCILGPILFLSYIKDINKKLNDMGIYLYADDTVVYVCGNNLVTIQSDLQRRLDLLSGWCDKNKLTVNTKKQNN